jgi:hypothetical protein
MGKVPEIGQIRYGPANRRRTAGKAEFSTSIACRVNKTPRIRFEPLLEMLAKVSDKPTSPTYAPASFCKERDANGIRKEHFAAAMSRVFQASKIHVESYDRPLRPASRLRSGRGGQQKQQVNPRWCAPGEAPVPPLALQAGYQLGTDRERRVQMIENFCQNTLFCDIHH